MEEKIDRIAEKNCKYFFCTRSDKTKLFFGLINSVFLFVVVVAGVFLFLEKNEKTEFVLFFCLFTFYG